MEKAIIVKKLDNWRGDATLYKLSKPMQYGWDEKTAGETIYVAVSSVVAPFSGAETFIFPADSDGNVLDWGELGGSYKGGLSHSKALKGAGFEIAEGGK